MKQSSKNATSRLLIHDSMSMSVRHKNIPSIFMVLHPLISLCGILSVIYCMHGFFGFQVDLKFMTLAAIAAVFSMFLIRSVSKKAGFAAVILLLLTVPVLLVIYRNDASLGAQNIYGMMHAEIFHEPWQPTGEFVTGGQVLKWKPELAVRAIRFLCDIVLVMLIALMEYTDVLLTQGHSGKIAVAIRFLMTFPFLESGLYFGLETSSAAVFLMVGFWISSIALVRPKLLRQTGNIQKTTDKLQRDFLFSSDKHFMPHEMAALMLVMMGGFGAFAAFKGSAGYSRAESLNHVRSDIMSMYRNFSIHDVTGLLNKIPFSLGVDTTSDDLDLTQRGALDFDGKTVLRAEVGIAADDKTDYYMRGIVRSEYTGHGWAVPKGKYLANMDLFWDLTNLNRVPQTLLHSETVDQYLNEDGKFEVVRCNIHALKSESVNYLPYQSICNEGVKYRYDTEVVLSDQQDYSFGLLNKAEPNLRQIMMAGQYDTDEPRIRDYQEFVREIYLDVPESDAIARVWADYRKSYNYARAQEAMALDNIYSSGTSDILTLYSIREYLWDKAEYTTSPGQTPPGEDFVEYFLLKNHRGFCAHYASAAVLLCRMAGIPARYVQGYVMTKGNFLDAALRNEMAGGKDDVYHIEIADNQAHAWVEFYVDGYGWVPFEFTESVTDQWHEPTVSPVVTSFTTTTAKQAGAVTTTTTTTAAVMTSSQPNGSTPGKPDSGFNYALLKKVMNVLLIVLCAAAIVFGWYAWHRAVTEKRRREMHGKNPNRSAEASYRYCLRLLEMLGIKQKGMPHEEFAIAAEADCRLLESGRLSETIHMMETVAFSRDGIAQDDAAQIADTVTALAANIYQNAKPLKRFWIRWVRHMA